MLCLASEIFPPHQQVLLEAAIKAGEVCWQYGLLLNGNGLSNGISGNGYMLHSLSRVLSKIPGMEHEALKWRLRTYAFAQSLCDPQIQEYISQYDDGVRLKKGTPDEPFSLMDGISGPICFLSDLLRDENDLRFPGYEV